MLYVNKNKNKSILKKDKNHIDSHHDPRIQQKRYYRGMPESDYRTVEEDEVDLVKLFQIFWSKRILIAKITGSFLILGLFIALFSPVEYVTEATLIPESQSSQGMAGSLLQQYGGLLGMTGNVVMGQEEGIPPQLYPDIAYSLPYQVELMSTPVTFSEYDTTVTVHSFFTEIYSPSLFGYLLEYTVGLPGKIIGLSSGDEEPIPLPRNVDRSTVLSLTKGQMETVEKLRERLTVSVDQKTGVLTLSSELPDPKATAEISQAGIKLLKEHIKQYRTEKARQNLQFVQEQVKSAKSRFQEAQIKLAEFRDSNVNLATAKAQTREQELQSQYDLAFNIYSSLSERLEQAKLALQEDTPVLSVIQPVSVPLEKSSPKRLLILIITGMLGGIISLGYVLVNRWWKSEKVRFT